MATQTFSIEFAGYWRDKNKEGIPAKSGIYCVYSCVYNINEKTVTLKKLIYIGEADNVKDRIANHEKKPKWEKFLGTNEELCYSFGPIDATNRVRCEAAMIFKHKPPVNTEYVDSFPFDQTTMKLSGETGFLYTDFTVNRT